MKCLNKAGLLEISRPWLRTLDRRRATLDPALDHCLKNVDVLILPIDSILTHAEVDAIVGKYNCKTAIPDHYFLNSLTTDISSLESADSWVITKRTNHHADILHLGPTFLLGDYPGLVQKSQPTIQPTLL